MIPKSDPAPRPCLPPLMQRLASAALSHPDPNELNRRMAVLVRSRPDESAKA